MFTNAEFANIVSSYALLISGIFLVSLTFLIKSHGKRWNFFYTSVFITAIATIFRHSMLGEFWPWFFDIGTNILVAWAVQFACVKDLRGRKVKQIPHYFGIIIVLYLIYIINTGYGVDNPLLSFGSYGFFHLGELLLALTAIVAFVLLAKTYFGKSEKVNKMIYLIFFTFLIGLGFAMGGDERLTGLISYHAIWHMIASFGFLLIWIMNHIRLGKEE